MLEKALINQTITSGNIAEVVCSSTKARPALLLWRGIDKGKVHGQGSTTGKEAYSS